MYTFSVDPVLITGITGAALMLFAFVMNQLHYWKDDYLIYDLVNVIGGILLTIYGVLLSAYPFAVLNAVWGLVSLRDVIKDISRNAQTSKRGFIGKNIK